MKVHSLNQFDFVKLLEAIEFVADTDVNYLLFQIQDTNITNLIQYFLIKHFLYDGGNSVSSTSLHLLTQNLLFARTREAQ